MTQQLEKIRHPCPRAFCIIKFCVIIKTSDYDIKNSIVMQKTCWPLEPFRLDMWTLDRVTVCLEQPESITFNFNFK